MFYVSVFLYGFTFLVNSRSILRFYVQFVFSRQQLNFKGDVPTNAQMFIFFHIPPPPPPIKTLFLFVSIDGTIELRTSCAWLIGKTFLVQ